MIGKLLLYFGPLGAASIGLWLLAMILVVAYVRPGFRSVRLAYAILFTALGSYYLGTVTSDNVSNIDVTEAPVTSDPNDPQRLKLIQSLKKNSADVNFAEDAGKDKLDVGGASKSELAAVEGRSVAPVDQKPADWKASRKKQTRPDDSKRNDQVDLSLVSADGANAPKATSQPSDEEAPRQPFRVLTGDQKVEALSWDWSNMFMARLAIFLGLVVVTLDYLRRLNATNEPIVAFPLANAFADHLFPKKRSVYVVNQPGRDFAPAYLETAVKKGETFIYFGPTDPWTSRSLPRTALIGRHFPVSKISISKDQPAFDRESAFESAWYGHACLAVTGEDEAMRVLREQLIPEMRRRQLSDGAPKTFHVAWNFESLPSPQIVNSLTNLSYGSNCKLLVASSQPVPAELAGSFDEILERGSARFRRPWLAVMVGWFDALLTRLELLGLWIGSLLLFLPRKFTGRKIETAVESLTTQATPAPVDPATLAQIASDQNKSDRNAPIAVPVHDAPSPLASVQPVSIPAPLAPTAPVQVASAPVPVAPAPAPVVAASAPVAPAPVSIPAAPTALSIPASPAPIVITTLPPPTPVPAIVPPPAASPILQSPIVALVGSVAAEPSEPSKPVEATIVPPDLTSSVPVIDFKSLGLIHHGHSDDEFFVGGDSSSGLIPQTSSGLAALAALGGTHEAIDPTKALGSLGHPEGSSLTQASSGLIALASLTGTSGAQPASIDPSSISLTPSAQAPAIATPSVPVIPAASVEPAAAGPSLEGRITFPCATCGKKLAVKSTSIGKSINCPNCKTSNAVPEQSVEMPRPAPVAPAVVAAPAPVVAPAAPSLEGRIAFPCGSCGKKLAVKTASIGKTINCPNCKTPNLVPTEAPAPTPIASVEAGSPSISDAPVAPVTESVIAAASSIATPEITVVAPVPTPLTPEISTVIVTPAPVVVTIPVEMISVPTPPATVETIVVPPASVPPAPASPIAPISAAPESIATLSPPSDASTASAAAPLAVSASSPVAASDSSSVTPATPVSAPASVTPASDAAPAANSALADRITFPCSNCGKKLAVKPTSIGKVINCPACQTGNLVPTQSPSIAPPTAAAVSVVTASTPVAAAPVPAVVVPPAAPAPLAPAAAPIQSAAAPEQAAAPAPAASPDASPSSTGAIVDRITFPCSQCHKKLAVKPTSIGKVINCPSCHTGNVVPPQSQAIAPPAPVAPAVPDIFIPPPPEQPAEVDFMAALDGLRATAAKTRPAVILTNAPKEPEKPKAKDLAEVVKEKTAEESTADVKQIKPSDLNQVVVKRASEGTSRRPRTASDVKEPAPTVAPKPKPAKKEEAVSKEPQEVTRAKPKAAQPVPAPKAKDASGLGDAIKPAETKASGDVQDLASAVGNPDSQVQDVKAAALAKLANELTGAGASGREGSMGGSTMPSRDESVVFTCSHCGKKLKVNVKFTGKKIKCANCSGVVVVP